MSSHSALVSYIRCIEPVFWLKRLFDYIAKNTRWLLHLTLALNVAVFRSPLARLMQEWGEFFGRLTMFKDGFSCSFVFVVIILFFDIVVLFCWVLFLFCCFAFVIVCLMLFLLLFCFYLVLFLLFCCFVCYSFVIVVLKNCFCVILFLLFYLILFFVVVWFLYGWWCLPSKVFLKLMLARRSSGPVS